MNFTNISFNTIPNMNKINTTEILDTCINECKTRTFMVLFVIFVLTLAEIILYQLKINQNFKDRCLEYIIMIRNIAIIVLFVYELFFFVLY